MKKEIAGLRVTVPGTGSSEGDLERLQYLATKFNDIGLDIVASEEKLGTDELKVTVQPSDPDSDIDQNRLEKAASMIDAAFALDG